MAGITLTDLQAVSAVAEKASFRAAAHDLGVSASSLSHQVAAMERRLGIRLFNRTTRSVSLTEAGETFLVRIRPALADIEGAIASVDRLRDTPTGLLRLNTSEGAAERALPVILDFLATYPEMRLDVVTDGRLVDIVAAGFDAGIRSAEVLPRDMVAVSFGMQEAFVVVASPTYLKGRDLPERPADLLLHECLRARLPSGRLVDWEFERLGKEVRMDVSGRLVLGSTDLSLQAALGSAGIAYVSLRSAEEALRDGALVQLLADWTPPYEGICLYYPSQRLPSAGLRAFIDHVKTWRRRNAAA